MGSRINRKLNMDYTKCLNSYGNLSKVAFYVQKTNKLPNTFVYGFGENVLDMDKVTDELIKEIFPNHEEVWSVRTKTNVKTSAVEETLRDDEIFDDNSVYLDNHYQDLGICIYNESILWDILSGSLSAYFTCSVDEFNEKLKDLISKLPFKENQPKEAEVKLVAFDGRDYYTITSKVKPTKINLSENYNDDFLPVYEDIVKFLDQRESGLIILNGIMGSGKTFMIRHLLSQHPKEYIIITNAMASHLSQPEFISFMLEHKNSIFILEDCEQILMERSENTFGGAIANILNMSDGLMSDIFNMKFICTFNADICKIDPAILRKGRCYARYEFGKLTKDKVENFAKIHNINLPEIKEMTLGELYNAGTSDNYQSQETHKKVGF